MIRRKGLTRGMNERASTSCARGVAGDDERKDSALRDSTTKMLLLMMMSVEMRPERALQCQVGEETVDLLERCMSADVVDSPQQYKCGLCPVRRCVYDETSHP